MPKSRQKKQLELTDLTEKLAKSKAVVMTSEKGVSVHDIEILRKELRKAGSEMQAIKKTLLNRVLKAQGLEVSTDAMQGMVGLAFSYEDEVAAAKIIFAFAKKNEGMAIVGGVLEKSYIDADKVKALALLPSKKEMQGILVRTIQAPVSGFVNALAGNLRNLVYVLSAVKDKKTNL